MTITDNLLACPIDGESLTLQSKQLKCSNGHAFDIARQGYVNLLPVQHKRSMQPGDSKEMVAARTNFLNTGIYAPVASKLVETILAEIGQSNPANIIDAGCGEGYYLDFVYKYFEEHDRANIPRCRGLDISKHAILQAAKRNKNIAWVVGTNREPPFLTSSIDLIFCVFGFHSFEGFNKILKPNGKVIIIEPGAGHLLELRKIIYSDVKKPSSSADNPTKNGFSMLSETKLRFNTGNINNEQFNQLLLMTPHFFRAAKQAREKAMQLDEIDLTVDIVFKVFEKK